MKNHISCDSCLSSQKDSYKEIFCYTHSRTSKENIHTCLKIVMGTGCESVAQHRPGMNEGQPPENKWGTGARKSEIEDPQTMLRPPQSCQTLGRKLEEKTARRKWGEEGMC